MSQEPSIQDVAKLAGVSLGTVSNVLNNPTLVRPQTANKVLAAVNSLGYVRNDAARQLKQGKSQALGLIVLDSTNPFFGDIARAAEDAADLSGFHILQASSSQSPVRQKDYIRMFQEQRLSGVLLSPVGDSSELRAQAESVGMKLVMIDHQSDERTSCSVSVDDIAGGQMAVEHLIATGKKKIGFVGGPLEITQIKDRLQGARNVVDQNPGVSLRVIPATRQDVISGREIGEEILNWNSSDWPEAIFAANDLLALGLIQAFRMEARVRVPEDIAIIGYDDIDFAKAAIVPLSSVRQPAKEIGATGVRLLLEEIEGEDHHHQHINFQPELVIRQSTVIK